MDGLVPERVHLFNSLLGNLDFFKVEGLQLEINFSDFNLYVISLNFLVVHRLFVDQEGLFLFLLFLNRILNIIVALSVLWQEPGHHFPADLMNTIKLIVSINHGCG